MTTRELLSIFSGVCDWPIFLRTCKLHVSDALTKAYFLSSWKGTEIETAIVSLMTLQRRPNNVFHSFWTAASLADILRRFKNIGRPIHEFPDCKQAFASSMFVLNIGFRCGDPAQWCKPFLAPLLFLPYWELKRRTLLLPFLSWCVFCSTKKKSRGM